MTDSIAQQIFEMFYRIMRAQRHQIQMHLKDLTRGEMFVLHHIQHEKRDGGVKMSDVAAKMMVTPSGITQFVKGLESRGLVERRRSDEDGRVVMIHTTKKGDNLLHASMKQMIESFSRLVESFGKKDSETLRELLVRAADFLVADTGVEIDEQEIERHRFAGKNTKE